MKNKSALVLIMCFLCNNIYANQCSVSAGTVKVLVSWDPQQIRLEYEVTNSVGKNLYHAKDEGIDEERALMLAPDSPTSTWFERAAKKFYTGFYNSYSVGGEVKHPNYRIYNPESHGLGGIDDKESILYMGSSRIRLGVSNGGLVYSIGTGENIATADKNCDDVAGLLGGFAVANLLGLL